MQKLPRGRTHAARNGLRKELAEFCGTLWSRAAISRKFSRQLTMPVVTVLLEWLGLIREVVSEREMSSLALYRWIAGQVYPSYIWGEQSAR